MSTDNLITLVVFSTLQLIALGAVLVSAGLVVTRVLRARQLIRIDGEIIGYKTVGSISTQRSARTFEQPIVRAEHDGETLELLHPVRSNMPPPVGTTVQLDVQRGPNGWEAEAASGLARYLAPVSVGLLACFLLVLLTGVELAVLF